LSLASLESCRRLVVKVGSSLLIDDDAVLDRAWLDDLVADIAALHGNSCEVIVVSSGAIAIGGKILGVNRRRARLPELQAAAAAGQVQLANAYSESLARHGITAAQILLTPEDTENRRRFLNARGTLTHLLGHRVVPVVNENDTVATEEIRYGDNDRLAARVAQLVMADMLLLLSDVDGLYTHDPQASSSAEHIPEVSAIDDDIIAMAGGAQSSVGTGGMATKLAAASIATHAGCGTIIADGRVSRPISALRAGARHTLFRAGNSPAAARKQWLAGALDVNGRINIDAGAKTALDNGNSLLPVGLLAVSGEFDRGDIVTICDAEGLELGRGLAEFSSLDAARIVGCHSGDIEQRLGYRGRSVMVHRDELVWFANDN
jgi:glutamate 5-kinase